MQNKQRKAVWAKISPKRIDALDTAYRSDFVSKNFHGFSPDFLKKMMNDGLLEPSKTKPQENYWITEKGLNIYKNTNNYKKLFPRG